MAIEAQRLTGSEAYSSPEELGGLFDQWKSSPEGQLAEIKIISEIQDIPSRNRDLIEPFRFFVFGIYLAQEKYPFTRKFPYPPITIDQTGEVATTGVRLEKYIDDKCSRAFEISLNKSWLLNPTGKNFSSLLTPGLNNEGVFRVISAGVEEYAHWILRKAIERYRSSEYISSLETDYQKTRREAEWSMNLVNDGLVDLESTGWLRDIYLVLTGKKGQQIRNVGAELRLTMQAILKHSSTIEEYMGLVWRNTIAKKYFPWTSTTKKSTYVLAIVTSFKQEQATTKNGLKSPKI